MHSHVNSKNSKFCCQLILRRWFLGFFNLVLLIILSSIELEERAAVHANSVSKGTLNFIRPSLNLTAYSQILLMRCSEYYWSFGSDMNYLGIKMVLEIRFSFKVDYWIINQTLVLSAMWTFVELCHVGNKLISEEMIMAMISVTLRPTHWVRI